MTKKAGKVIIATTALQNFFDDTNSKIMHNGYSEPTQAIKVASLESSTLIFYTIPTPILTPFCKCFVWLTPTNLTMRCAEIYPTIQHSLYNNHHETADHTNSFYFLM
jgi:hypothetical protein